MAGKPEIILEEHGSKGRYFIRPSDAESEAELTFSRMSENLVIVDHTGVPDSLRGRGYGKILAARIVEDAREKGFKIVPLCPFFKAQADRHPEWADVIQG